MKIQSSLLSILLAVIPASIIAQEHSVPENPIKCGQHIQHARMLEANPAFHIQDSIDQANFEIEYQNYLTTFDPHERSAYTIPVVVHVVHLGGPENISDEQIYNALDHLNKDFNMTNSDLSNTVSAFSGITGNASFEFKLATKDPNGNCHSGITRTFSQTTYDTGMNQGHPIVDAVAAQHGVWPQNKYMSVFVCIDPSGAAGYTYRPSNAFNGNQMYGAIFMRHDYMGTIGTSSNSARHTLSHEAGHWFNLAHLWGNSNSPGIATNCNGDDGVSDTPNTIGWQSCNLTGMSCGSLDNVQNIMEYSYCSTMFTQLQAARMQTAVNSSIAGRNNLITNSNLAARGVLVPSNDICEAKFLTNRQVVCQGQSIDFSDVSVHNVTNRSWTFNGGSPATSSDSTATVTYNTPGDYTVTLQVSNSTDSETTTITNFIKVLGVPGIGFPYTEGFENQGASFPDGLSFSVDNPLGDHTWKISYNTGNNSSKCVYIPNYLANTVDKDRLISGTIDLSVIDPSDQMTFSFDYAYHKRNSSDDEWLKVYISNDCGETWALRKILHGSALSNQVSSSNYVPDPDDWRTITITTTPSSFYTSNFRYMFEFESENGNNIYLDNINLTAPGYVSNGSEIELVKSSANLYPNPTHDISILNLKGYEHKTVTIKLYDVTGKVISEIYNGSIETNDFNTDVHMEDLSEGLYFVKINSEGELTEEAVKLLKR